MIKKMMLLAVAVAAVAAFAVPASASATMYFHNGEPIPAGGVNANYTGSAAFHGGIKCTTVDATIHFETESAKVTAFEGTECATTEELAKACTLSANPFGTFGAGGWPIDVESATTVRLTNVNIDNPMVAGCPFGTNVTASGSEVHATATVEGDATHFTLGGQLTALGANHTVTGTLATSTAITFE